MLAKEEFPRVLDHRLDQVAGLVDRGGPAPAKHLRLLEDVFEGGDDKGILGREVMKLSASGQTGFLRDLGGPETRIAALGG